MQTSKHNKALAKIHQSPKYSILSHYLKELHILYFISQNHGTKNLPNQRWKRIRSDFGEKIVKSKWDKSDINIAI